MQPIKLHDCLCHGIGSGAELFIVEGDSAAQAVRAARDRQYQAVLPMQGKPLNAMRASRAEVERYPLYRELLCALGYASEPGSATGRPIAPAAARYEKVILLFDPDADGIHCGALLLMFIFRRLKPLLDAGLVSLVHAPLLRIDYLAELDGGVRTQLAYTEHHAKELVSALEAKGQSVTRKARYRGLASLEADILKSACLDPPSRLIHRLSSADAEAAIAMFSWEKGKSKSW